MKSSMSPKRLDEHDNEVDLPSLGDLNEDDELYLRYMLALAEHGAMVRGRYVEAHVARLLGAVFPTVGISPWDLQIPGSPPIPIQVKSSQDKSFKLNGFFNNDLAVWVFVRLGSSDGTRPREFSYAVAGPEDRRRLQGVLGASVSVRKLFAFEHLRASADDLLSQVKRRSA